MQVGFLTGPFGNESLEFTVEYAAKAGFDCLEVASGIGSKHFDPSTATSADADKVRKLFDDHKLGISSLAWYGDLLNPAWRDDHVKAFHKFIDLAAQMGVEVVCTLGGMAVEGKDRFQTIEEDCKTVFTELADHAGEKGIKIALENWFETNLRGLAHFERMFQAISSPNFGLNFDPSHLVHQEIDYFSAIEHFRDRIFHTHAKDTEIRYHVREWLGVLTNGWWRYVIPGRGVIKWGEYISQLRALGYNGVLSIEHEDGAVGREEGMEKGLAYLKQFA